MGKRVTLNIVSDLYSPPDKNGKDKLIKKNIRTKMDIDIDLIEMPVQIMNNKGKIIKNKCRIQVRDYGPLVVNHSWEEISKLKNEEHKQIKGFRR